MIGRCPWDSLDHSEAVKLQAAMARVASHKGMEEHDFTIPGRGSFRAWIYFTPLRESRMMLLVRETPTAILLLTKREREICRLLAEGKSSREIAAKLRLARNTVDAHRGRIAARLKLTRKALASWCGHFQEWL